MLCGDFMVRANNRTLEQGPRVFDSIRVYVAANVFFLPMVNRFVRRVGVLNSEVGGMAVSHQMLGIRRSCFLDPLAHDLLTRILAALFHFHADRSPAFDSTKYHPLVFEVSTVLKVALAANPSLIQFYGTAQRAGIRFGHCLADAMAKIPCRLVGHFERALELVGRHAFLGFAHQIGSEKPLPKWQVRIMEDRASRRAELVIA